jgi:hypothetical protein
MGVSEQMTALVSHFPNRRQAERFVAALRRAGFRADQVGMVSPRGADDGAAVEEGALAGALTGLAPGAIAGAVVAGLIPGVGPVLAVGILAGVLGGAAAGATTGGLLGALLALGLSEEEAQRSEAAVRAGQTLVAVSGNGRLGEAAAILRHLNQEDGSETTQPPATA